MLGQDTAYFDNAATTFPKPAQVYDFMNDFYRSAGGNPGRGTHSMAQSSGRMIDETRLLLQQILQCPNKTVVFQPSATQALNVIIDGVTAMGAKNIYISPFEHNAVTRVLNRIALRQDLDVRKLPVTRDLRYDLEAARMMFDEQPPDMIVLSHASNVIGLLAPAAEVFTLGKQYSALTVLDMAQTAGVVDFQTGSDHVDFAVFAGHKTLLGPTGISGFVMNPRIGIDPLVYGGTGMDSANPGMPGEAPRRFEAGTANVWGIAGLNAAARWILSESVGTLCGREAGARRRLLDILAEYDFIEVVGNIPDHDYVGIVSCRIEDIASDTAATLFNERGVSVRGGLHCAPMAHEFLGTAPSGTIRLSVSPLTTEQDFKVLKAALDDIEAEL